MLLELSTTNGGVSINGSAGELTLYLSDEQTDLLNFQPAVYGLEVIYPDGTEERLLEGRLTLSRRVTE